MTNEAGSSASPRMVSPEVADLLERIREYYRAQGKTAAASNYVRHLRTFMSWVEGNGYSMQNLPADSVETFLGSTDYPETTKYVMRTQIRSALRTAHNELGVDFAHLQYESGKPAEVRQVMKNQKKAKREEKKAEKAAQKQAVATLQLPFIPAPSIPEPEVPFMADNTPQEMPASPPPSPQQQQQPFVVVVPQQQMQKAQQNQTAQRPMATIGGGTPQRGITINNHTFTNSHIRVSRVADGSDPFVPMGTETFVTTLMASQVAPHGDVAGYMQQFIIPKLRLSPNTSQVPFVFYELNDKKQPTGRRDELVVGVPLHMVNEGATPVPNAGGFGAAPTPAAHPFDPATQFMLKKLEADSEAAQRREEKLAEELSKAKDSQMQFFLMQQMQREQELKRELEERKMFEMQRAQQAAAMPPAPPPAPIIMPEPRPDPAFEMARVNAEANSRLLEAVLVRAMTPPPAPPPPAPTKDVTEWLIPLMVQMNQQAQAQQQQNQQLLVSVMQGMMNREDPTVKLLRDELREVKAQANAPKEDDFESFADKFQKIKMISEMMPGGGGGEKGGGLFDALISNFDTIGAGIAKVLSGRSPTPMNGTPEAPPQAPTPQLAAPQPTQTEAEQQQPPQVDPTETRRLLAVAAAFAEQEGKEKDVVEAVVQMVNTFASMPEPYANIGRRIVTAFGQVEDLDDLIDVSKHLWVATGQKPDKPVAKAIAKALYAWFPLLHRNIYGELKFLAGQSPETYTPPPGAQPTSGVSENVAPDMADEDGEDEDEDETEEVEADDDIEADNNAVAATVGA